MAAPDDDPGLPIRLGPCSNGEFLPSPPTPFAREVARRSREAIDRNARRVGMTRRRFLLSSMASATVLSVLAACSSEAERGSPGGTFTTDPDAGLDPDAARDAVGGDEFVFDVQGHFLEYPDGYDGPIPDFPQADCGEGDPAACFSADTFLDLIFGRSDTDMVVLSALPFAGSPLSPDVMARTIDRAERLCGDRRVLMQGEAHPSDGPLDEALAQMADLASRFDVGAWKVYTHAGGPGWYLDDHDPSAPPVGAAFLAEVGALGPGVVAVHKGFSGGSRFADPVDVGPAAVAHPDLTFVVYHAGYEPGVAEGPYDPEVDEGVNRLITSARNAGVGPGGNVVAELGSTWRSVMGRPTEAAHLLGKLLVAFGEDNVVWGTDSIWYGSPQDQIQAFRAFEISAELQERHGYPALTPELKAKVLGLSSARIYGIDPIRDRCALDREAIEQARQGSPDTNRVLGPTTAAAALPLVASHRLAHG